MIREPLNSRPFNTPQCHLLSRDQLDAISAKLASIEGGKEEEEVFEDLGALQLYCFDRVFSLLQAEKWDLLAQLRGVIDPLVDLNGHSLFDHFLLITEEGACASGIKEMGNRHLFNTLSNGKFKEVLFVAAKLGKSSEVIDALKASGCSPNQKNRKNRYPLHAAIRKDHPELIGPLTPMTFKGEPLPMNTLRYTKVEIPFCPYSLAVYKGHIQCLKELVKNSSNQLSGIRFGEDQKTLIHLAVLMHQHEMLRHLIIEHKEEMLPLLDFPDSMGRTPLMVATKNNDLTAMAFLIKHGALVSRCDYIGDTALHYAAVQRNKVAAYLLLKSGGDLSAPNMEGKIPLQLVSTSDRDSLEIKEEKEAFCNAIHTLSAAIERGKRSGLVNHIENTLTSLSWMGGGPKCVAYLGPIEVCEKEGIIEHCVRQAGCSGGAITATFLAAGAGSGLLSKLLAETHGYYFFDVEKGAHGSLGQQVGRKIVKSLFTPLAKSAANPNSPATAADAGKNFIRGAATFTGICQGKHFLDWIELEITNLTGIEQCTFGELAELVRRGARSTDGRKFQHLHLFAINLSTNQIIRFSSEDTDETMLQVVISSAVRCSMSIPVLYIPMIPIRKMQPAIGKAEFCTERGTVRKSDYDQVVDAIVKKEVEGEPSYCDPGLIFNCPADAFNQRRYIQNAPKGPAGEFPEFNPHALGFALGSPADEEMPDITTIRDPVALFKAFFAFYYSVESLITSVVSPRKYQILTLDHKNIGLLEFGTSPREGKGKRAVEAAKEKMEAFLREQKESASRVIMEFEADLPESEKGPQVPAVDQQLAKAPPPLVFLPSNAVVRGAIEKGLSANLALHNLTHPSKNNWRLDTSPTGNHRAAQRNFALWLLKNNPVLEDLHSLSEKNTPFNIIKQDTGYLDGVLGSSPFSQQVLPYLLSLRNVKMVEYLSSRNIPLHVDMSNGEPLLHHVLALDYEDVFEALVQAQDYKLSLDRAGNTVLHRAVVGGYSRAYNVLQKHKKLSDLVNVQNQAGATPLITCLQKGRKEFFSLLLEIEEIDLTCCEPGSNKSVLRLLAEARWQKEFADFIKIAKDRDEFEKILKIEHASADPLIFKLEKGYYLKTLINEGIDITKTEANNEKTLLYNYAKDGDLEWVKIFCENLKAHYPKKFYPILDHEVKSSKINKATGAPMQKTALTIAAEKNNHKVVKQLLDYGADYLKVSDGKKAVDFAPNALGRKQAYTHLSRAATEGGKGPTDQERINDFRLACQYGDKEWAKRLVKKNFPFPTSIRDAEGNGCLLIAIKFGRNALPGLVWSDMEELVQYLIDQDDDLNQADHAGMTPIMCAARRDTEALKILLEYEEVKVDQEDHEGNTALHHAVMAGRRSAVKALLAEEDVNANHLNHAGKSPHMLAQTLGKPEILAYFSEEE